MGTKGSKPLSPPHPTLAVIARRLRAALLEDGRDWQAVATEAEVDRSAMVHALGKQSGPPMLRQGTSIDLILKLADALKKSPAYLCGGEREPENEVTRVRSR